MSQPAQYGPRLKALACYLYSQQFIPLARIRELLTALYGDAPSEPVVLAAARQHAKGILCANLLAQYRHCWQQTDDFLVVQLISAYN